MGNFRDAMDIRGKGRDHSRGRLNPTSKNNSVSEDPAGKRQSASLASMPNCRCGGFQRYSPCTERSVSQNSVAAASKIPDVSDNGSPLPKSRVASANERAYRSLLDGIPECVALIGGDGLLLEINAAGLRMLEADTFSSLIGTSFLALVAPEHRDLFCSFNDQVCGGEEDRILAYDLITAGGRRLDVETHGIPFRNAGGQVVQLSVTRNITEVKQAEKRQTLLNQELNHRFKNSLGMVQSMVTYTLRNASSCADAQETLEARIGTLARTFDTLLQANWQYADLADILRNALQPFLASSRHISMDGPQIRLRPDQAKALSMVFHELATNASKYGALTSESGRVDVTWRLVTENSKPRFLLRWSESLGPYVAPPEHQGFGTWMIEALTASELGGEAKLAFLSTGLICEIEVPVHRLAQ